MSILLHKPYLVKVTTKGGGDQKYLKIWPRGLWIAPYENAMPYLHFFDLVTL